MADATVDNVMADAAAELGDFTQEVYDNTKLMPFYRSAYTELWDCMMNHGLQKTERTVTYSLPANTTSLTPATAGITDMGEPFRLWERNTSGDRWDEMEQQDELPQSDPTDMLRWWSWQGDTFLFVGSGIAKSLKIQYYASGSAPTSGSIGIDNCRNFLAVRTASLMAAAMGMQDRKVELAQRALGPSLQPDGSGGLLRQFISPMVKRILPVRPKPWRTRRPHI